MRLIPRSLLALFVVSITLLPSHAAAVVVPDVGVSHSSTYHCDAPFAADAATTVSTPNAAEAAVLGVDMGANFIYDSPSNPVATNTADDVVNLYRAPQRGQATGPLDPADFPGSYANGYPDGRSYWTPNRELADEFASAYGTDVISVSVPRADYDSMLDVLKHAPGAGEFPYPGAGGFTEVAIPRWMIPWLNRFGPGPG